MNIHAEQNYEYELFGEQYNPLTSSDWRIAHTRTKPLLHDRDAVYRLDPFGVVRCKLHAKSISLAKIIILIIIQCSCALSSVVAN